MRATVKRIALLVMPLALLGAAAAGCADGATGGGASAASKGILPA